MGLIQKNGAVEIWHDLAYDEYYVYVGEKMIRTCPSIGMAREVAAGY